MQPTQGAMIQSQAFIQSIRRRPTSSTDIDFHRAQAAALRRHARRDAAALKAAGLVVMIAMGLAAVLIFIAVTFAPAA